LDISKIGNKFKVAVLAAKRAKQIMKTGKKKVDIKASNPLTVALAEIENGLIDYEILREEERAFIEEKIEQTATEEITDETENSEITEEIENNTKTEDEAATEEEILRKNLTTE
jgi:DNA-directed RNA polymerase subunit omega